MRDRGMIWIKTWNSTGFPPICVLNSMESADGILQELGQHRPEVSPRLIENRCIWFFSRERSMRWILTCNKSHSLSFYMCRWYFRVSNWNIAWIVFKHSWSILMGYRRRFSAVLDDKQKVEMNQNLQQAPQVGHLYASLYLWGRRLEDGMKVFNPF